MKCEFDCLPSQKSYNENTDTYNEHFIMMNSDKIIQKIKTLMKIRYFYKKNDLIRLINIPKPYPKEQIYAALSQMINDEIEYITDKYDRNGHLVNIGEYYMFQPSELNNKQLSIFERSVPINYKHNSIKFEIKQDAINQPIVDVDSDVEVEENKMPIVNEKFEEGKKILEGMYFNYIVSINTEKSERGNENWYHLCGSAMKKLEKESKLIVGDIDEERRNFLDTLLVEHIVDELTHLERIELLNYIYSNPTINNNSDDRFKRFYSKINTHLMEKRIASGGITGMLLYDGPSRKDNMQIYVLNDKNKWVIAGFSDKKRLLEDSDVVLKKYTLDRNKLYDFVGFIGIEKESKYMVFKLKDKNNQRSTGFRCHQSGKIDIVTRLNKLEETDIYSSKGTKDSAKELCVREEMVLRSFQKQNKYNKTWFVDTETAIFNEFEKREK
jgi:hypothetical protein